MNDFLEEFEILVAADGGRRLPQWRRTILVHRETGELFVAATDADAMCAMYDGATMVLHRKKPFLSLEWMRAEHPEVDWDKLEKAVREQLAA